TVLAAFVLLLASFAQTQLFTVVTGFFILVICHLQHVAHDAYTRAGSWFDSVLALVIATLFPNFQLFALADGFAAGNVPAAAELGRTVLYGLGYVCVTTALAIFSF